MLFLLLGSPIAALAEAPSFRNEVQPILTRYGCNMGACHGAAAGQGGFRLSLRGFDDEGDYLSITRSAMGRRINDEDPARSLLLLKAVKTVPHKGDKRFEMDSEAYRTLVEWIAQGSPGPKTTDARLTALEVSPKHLMGKPGMQSQLKVMAQFSDGRREDVTRWAKFNAVNASVATVDDQGLVKVAGAGESTVSAWYLSRLDISTISVPQQEQVSEALFAQLKARNFVDEHVLTKLRALNIPPSQQCTDGEFIRRAFLDTLGVLPTTEETRAFLTDSKADKRDRLIESILKRPEFVDYWSHRWSDLLLVNSDKLSAEGMWAYYHWIRNRVAANTPWDVMVRELLTATGSTLENGAGNFFLLHDEPTRLAETVSVAFLGTAMNCAKCHNHPLEKWTNDEYFAFANLFSRIRTKNGATADERIVFSATEGDLVQPLTGKPQPPRALEVTQPLAMSSPEDRRIAMADWLTSPNNRLFKRTITNRVWANFFGVGLVEAVDDIRITNPASNEALMDAACEHLVKNHFDLKALMRVILQSETYQRSSESLPANKVDVRYYSHFYPRRLKAEVLLDSIAQVTAVPTTFAIDRRNANRGTKDIYPMGFRALQLPDSNIASYFLKSFGRADRISTCECERTNEPSMAQALHIANGDTLNEKLSAVDNRLDHLLKASLPNEKLIEEAYLTALARPPSATEKSKATELLATASPKDRRATLEDIFWGLMSSKEFLFQH
ncbi:Ig-like domain (group 2) [Prosthecobacter debontii]|uniref:Ig-like domain (Group 2) n=1 Tax=Prosthecobacter debontii TaxID=48467 RepID=A0A1T4Y3M9_9BACT|nr:DUF1553 domain-containing protein [Prosthecobacter debontii]SKA96412.1 Ig-like domain (group 2) [Prosthecobacter debontii]